jgi:hypothetical protein
MGHEQTRLQADKGNIVGKAVQLGTISIARTDYPLWPAEGGGELAYHSENVRLFAFRQISKKLTACPPEFPKQLILEFRLVIRLHGLARVRRW